MNLFRKKALHEHPQQWHIIKVGNIGRILGCCVGFLMLSSTTQVVVWLEP
jgi:hypothetical protein